MQKNSAINDKPAKMKTNKNEILSQVPPLFPNIVTPHIPFGYSYQSSFTTAKPFFQTVKYIKQ